MLVRQLPPEAALWRSIDPEAAGWGLTEHLLAAAVDHLAYANWQRPAIHVDSAKRGQPPRPLPRPGVDDLREGERRFTGKPMSIAEVRRRLDEQRAAAQEVSSNGS